jgi:hypothetical protein
MVGQGVRLHLDIGHLQLARCIIIMDILQLKKLKSHFEGGDYIVGRGGAVKARSMTSRRVECPSGVPRLSERANDETALLRDSQRDNISMMVVRVCSRVE